ncbi:MAG TPA: hypothetical protein VGK19_12830 [Capsulimonadaceae bacterium]|jgi:uncharacterized membrane protein YebE (DUF533 family)
MKSYKTAVIAATLLATIASLAPVASASQKTKNDWRNLGTGAAAVGVLGALKGDKTMTGVGIAGAGYSAYRYEQDRKHQSQENSARKNRAYHSTSSRKYYTYGGHRYYKNLNTGARVRVN